MGTPTLKTLTRSDAGAFEWVMVRKNDTRALNTLQEKFDYHKVDLLDAAPPIQRPKISVRDGYIFLVLQYPVFNRQTKIVTPAEVDFFISPERLVTVDTTGLPALQDAYRSFHESIKPGSPYAKPMVQDIPHLLYHILNELTLSIYPMLRHLAADVEELDSMLFTQFERGLITELLRVKTNIVNVRKTMQGHKAVMRKLVEAAEHRFVNSKRIEEYFDQLVETTKDIWDNLELQRETVNALHETSASLVDYHTNEIMRTLTIISVITFPLTLLATLFSTRLMGVPFLENPWGFWILFTVILVLAVSMLGYFRYRKWV